MLEKRDRVREVGLFIPWQAHDEREGIVPRRQDSVIREENWGAVWRVWPEISGRKEHGW